MGSLWPRGTVFPLRTRRCCWDYTRPNFRQTSGRMVSIRAERHNPLSGHVGAAVPGAAMAILVDAGNHIEKGDRLLVRTR